MFFRPSMITSFWLEVLMLIETIIESAIFTNYTIFNIKYKYLLDVRILIILQTLDLLLTKEHGSRTPLKYDFHKIFKVLA